MEKTKSELFTYLCGGIDGLTDWECNHWREYAAENLTTSIYDPMRRDYRGVEDDFVDDIVMKDLTDISSSAYVLVNATRPSWGTAMEIVYAHNLSKVVVAFTGNVNLVSPWLRYHCTKICYCVDDAISIINSGELEHLTKAIPIL